ncbi:MAG: hypothetical protein LAT67_09145 [Balneolales bacterium]|nr:hypothetical protein [Balneolales bacterium]
MQKSYWESRWIKDKTGFHASKPEVALEEFWNYEPKDGFLNVAVPLCGKTMDMIWLAEKGHSVIGIEFIKKACEDFFTESHSLTGAPEVQVFPRGIRYSSPNINVQLIQGDYLKLISGDILQNPVSLLYDRAALVALPPALRKAYIKQHLQLFPDLKEILLITFVYDTSIMQGPPFSIPDDEVRSLFKNDFRPEVLKRENIIDQSEKYQRMGLQEMTKVSWRLKRK